MNFALIENGIVENTIICESEDLAKELYPNTTIVNIDGIPAGLGWSYDGNTFTAPTEEKSPDEIAAESMATARSEYDRATLNISALDEQIEDADYAGTTEEEVKADLASWTDYRKQLRAYIKAGDGSKDLPVAPAV